MEQSKQAFPKTVLRLLEDEGISQRELARRTERHGWGSAPAINGLIKDNFALTIEAIEAVASALQVPPEHFQEYGMLQMRDSIDPNKVGSEKALKNFKSLRGALDGRS